MLKKILCASALLVSTTIVSLAQSDVIRIATDGAYPPWNMSKPDGGLEGFEIDLANNLCAKMKAECVFVTVDWDGFIPALVANKVDLLVSGMGVTDERKKMIDFSHIYAREANGFGVMPNSTLANLAFISDSINIDNDPETFNKLMDLWRPFLQSKVIGVQSSSVYPLFLDKYLKDIVEIREYNTTDDHDLDLSLGRIDAIFASESYLRGAQNKDELKEMTISGTKLIGKDFGDGLAFGIRKGDADLKGKLDLAIEESIKDGTTTTLYMKWFDYDMSPQL